MEKEYRESSSDVQIAESAYEGLEFIRRSGATNLSDRQMVLDLAREWDLTDTADWIESVDIDTYRGLIVSGPDVIGNESLDEKLDRMDREYDEERRVLWEDKE